MNEGETPSAPESIRPDHDVGQFDSGVAVLDDWLRRRALPNEAAGASRTFVACTETRVAGYYSLAAGSVMHGVATSRTRRNMPDPIPVVLLGRLAIDRSWQGRGLGAKLLRDCVLRVIGAAGAIGVRALLVHAISEEAKAFYERFGFRASPIEPMTLMLTLEEISRTLESAR
ncbi:MAG TPA: GNAT family N-acetyltransferase [Caulobacteraceae bacterium]